MSAALVVLWRFPVADSDRDRAIAVSADEMFHVVSLPKGATIGAGGIEVQGEVAFGLYQGIAHAEAVLSGDPRAMTQPGGLRVIAATAKVLAGMLLEPGAAEAMRRAVQAGAAKP